LLEKVSRLSYTIYLPYSLFYKIWMVAIITVFIYNLLFVPLQIAFGLYIPAEYAILDVLTILINIYDLKVRARTAIDK
jgi:hypothetical protein